MTARPSPKRYDFQAEWREFSAEVIEQELPDGDYVKWSDYDTLRAEAEGLRAALKKLRKALKKYATHRTFCLSSHGYSSCTCGLREALGLGGEGGK